MESEIEVMDLGSVWHVEGDRSITKSQELDYLDKTNNTTGIKYAIGPKPTGGTGIRYVRYPKYLFVSADAIKASPDVKRMLQRCNVCSAMDQVANTNNGKSPLEASLSPQTEISNTPLPNNLRTVQSPVERVSLGDAVGGNFLPRYVPFLLNIVQGIALKPAGKAVVSAGLSVLADMLSGSVQDPGLKRAWKCAADGFIDEGMCTTEFSDLLSDNVATLLDSYHRDGDLAVALKKSLIKSPDEIMEPIRNRAKHKGVGVSLTKQQTTSYKVGFGGNEDPLATSNMIG